MKTIAVICSKGGVGKTTTVSAVGAGLVRKGFKVLVIDTDAQCNLTYSYGITSAPFTTLELLTGSATALDAVQHTAQGDIIPAKSLLSVADQLLQETGKEYKLREALAPLNGVYDYVLIDTPPSLGILTINALTACDSVIIPVQADAYSLQGVGQLANNQIDAVKKYTNPALKIDGLLITRYKARTTLAKELRAMLEATADQLGTKLYATPIRECTALQEAQVLRKTIYEHAPKSNASADYMALVEEITEDGKE